MPAFRSNKQAPTNTASDVDNHPPRRSARLMEKGQRVSPVDIPQRRRVRKTKARLMKRVSSSSPVSLPAPTRLLRINTGATGPANVNGSARQLGVGCCALRTPCVVCFSQDHLLTPLYAEPSYHRPPPQQSPLVGTLRPAVWSSTASEFSLPPTPARDFYANFHGPNVDANPGVDAKHGAENGTKLGNRERALVSQLLAKVLKDANDADKDVNLDAVSAYTN